MNQLIGKGFFIWKIPNCENGDPEAIAYSAHQAGLSHVLIKIANGIYDFNFDPINKKDLIGPVATALKKYGIQVWGWHYVFGDLPEEEAKAAIRQLTKIPLDGYVIDAELEYKDKYTPSRIFLKYFRESFPSMPVALSSFRYPKYHPQLPWADFLTESTLNMPQVYWEQAHNPADQLRQSISEFQLISPFRPIIPTGPTFCATEWCPSAQEVIDFMNTSIEMNIPAVNFFSWDYCRSKLPQLWDTIANFAWPGVILPKHDVVEILIEEMNLRNIKNILDLYSQDAVLVTASATLQGRTTIQTFYENLLNSTLINHHFKILGLIIKDNSRQFNWSASIANEETDQFNDSIGLIDQKIIYHYSSQQSLIKNPAF